MSTYANFTTTEQAKFTNVSWKAVTTDEYLDYEYDIVGLATHVVITATFGLSILILIGIAGNVMTINAYFEDRKYNKIYDFFILNLAITDLIICSICIPFNTAFVLTKFIWPFGYWSCKIWLFIEFIATVESTLLILILSTDRLLMISLGTMYMQKVTWNAAKTVLFLSWIISFLYYGPAMLWDYFRGSTLDFVDFCDVEFVYEEVFVIIMPTMEFLVPFVSLAIINGLLLSKIWRWTNIRQQAKSSKVVAASNHKVSSSCSQKTTEHIGQCGDLVMPVAEMEKLPEHSNRSIQQMSAKIGFEKNKSSSSGSRAKLKSVKFLASLVLAFLICWLPYQITTLMISVCSNCVNTTLYEFFIWLLLTKSILNPFIYAFNSPRYRRCFRRYITLNGRICHS